LRPITVTGNPFFFQKPATSEKEEFVGWKKLPGNAELFWKTESIFRASAFIPLPIVLIGMILQCTANAEFMIWTSTETEFPIRNPLHVSKRNCIDETTPSPFQLKKRTLWNQEK